MSVVDSIPTSTHPTALVRAQHEQQSTLVKAGYVTVNTTGNSNAGEPRYGRGTSGWTLLIRAIKPDKGSEYKNYTLRNFSHSFKDLIHLKTEITSQLVDKVSSDPDCGYCKGQTIGCGFEMYHTLVSQGNTCTLWCDAIFIVNTEGTQLSQVIKSLIVKVKGYQKEKESVLQEQKEHDEEVKSELHNKHGDSYTPFQYALQAEIVDIGTYKILGQSPTSADVHRKKFYG